jgi:hypothetical protein
VYVCVCVCARARTQANGCLCGSGGGGGCALIYSSASGEGWEGGKGQRFLDKAVRREVQAGLGFRVYGLGF